MRPRSHPFLTVVLVAALGAIRPATAQFGARPLTGAQAAAIAAAAKPFATAARPPPRPPSPPPSPPQPPYPPAPPPSPPSPPTTPAKAPPSAGDGVVAAAAAEQGAAQSRPPPLSPPSKSPPRKPPGIVRPKPKPRPPPKQQGAAAGTPPPRPPPRRKPPPRPKPVRAPPAVVIPPYTGARLLPADRALDWSNAGYREGLAPIPTPPTKYNVRSFGAKGDGATDDTAALEAVVKAANANPGVIFFPPGVYILRRTLTLVRGNTVLRGAGPGQSIIQIPVSLSEVYRGTWTSDANGNVKSAWSSGGAFINFVGRRQGSNNARTLLATITGAVSHGAIRIPVGNVARLRVGQRVRIFVNDQSTFSTRRRKLQQEREAGGSAVDGEGGDENEAPLPNSVRVAQFNLTQQLRQDPVFQLALQGQQQLGDTSDFLTPQQAAQADAEWLAAASAAATNASDASAGNGGFAWEEPWPAEEAAAGTGAIDGADLALGDQPTATLQPPSLLLPPPPSTPELPKGEQPTPAEEPPVGAHSALAAALQAAGYSLGDLSTSNFDQAQPAAAGDPGTTGQPAGLPGGQAAAGTGAAATGAAHPANEVRAAANSLVAWAYGESLVESGPGSDVLDRDEVAMTAKVAGVVRTGADGSGYLVLDRAMPFPVKWKMGWKGSIHLDSPSIEDSGIERLGIRFRHTLAMEHHADRGYNGIQVSNAANFWVKEVAILNADNALFYSWVHRSTIEDVTLSTTQSRVNPAHPRDLNGHHGITITEAQANLVQRVNVASPLIHDVTVTSGSSLNVVQNCRGKNLNLDMHRTAPFNNLFTNINMGAGTRPFASGGRADRGAYSGRGNTYWGLHSASGRPLVLPGCSFGPYLNFVGNYRGFTCPAKSWMVQGLRGRPSNLYLAQRYRG